VFVSPSTHTCSRPICFVVDNLFGLGGVLRLLSTNPCNRVTRLLRNSNAGEVAAESRRLAATVVSTRIVKNQEKKELEM